MSTTDHFFDLSTLAPRIIPFFWNITGFLVIFVCVAVARQTLKFKQIPWKQYWIIVILLPSPVLFIWIGARLIHYDETAFPNDSDMEAASYWPQLLLLGLFILFTTLAWQAFKKQERGRVLFGSILALELWVILCAAFVADVAVCGDYYRFIV